MHLILFQKTIEQIMQRCGSVVIKKKANQTIHPLLNNKHRSNKARIFKTKVNGSGATKKERFSMATDDAVIKHYIT